MKIYPGFSNEELQKMLQHCLLILYYQLELASDNGTFKFKIDDQKMLHKVYPIIDTFMKCSAYLKEYQLGEKEDLQMFYTMYDDIIKNTNIDQSCPCHGTQER